MAHHRKKTKKARTVSTRTKNLILDERMLLDLPQTVKENLHQTHEPRKPDSTGLMTRNGGDVDQNIEVCFEDITKPYEMELLKFGDKYPASVAQTLRLMVAAGATKDNDGTVFGDDYFTSMALIEAMEVEFPKWGYIGKATSQVAGAPRDAMNEYCASTTARPRQAGFNAFMETATRSGKTKVHAIGHKYNQSKTEFFLSTVGDCSMGKDYMHKWNDENGDKQSDPVARPLSVCDFFSASGKIDFINRQAKFELRLFQLWPTKRFWVKYHIDHEGMILVDMYMHYRKHGFLESQQDTGHTETLVMFIDRMLAGIDVRYDSKVVELATPKKGADGRPEPLPLSSGRKRQRPTLDGDHEMRPTVYVTKKSKKGTEYQESATGACCVCKYHFQRKKGNDRYPKTTNWCTHCEAWVHSRGSPGYSDCWSTHLHTKIAGMKNSGDHDPE